MSPRTWRGRVFIGTSVDGKIAREDGTLEWLTDPPAQRHDIPSENDRPALIWETFYPDVDAIVMGRSTYDSVLGLGEWPFEGKHVLALTRRHDLDDPRIRPVASIDAAVELLNELGVSDVYVDGGRTIQSFLHAGLVDEITISIAPVLIGSGRALFGSLDSDVLLTLRGTHATEDGLVRITYEVSKP